MKTVVKNYLSVSKKQWNALVILMVLIVIVLTAPYAYQLVHINNSVNTKGFARAAAGLQQAEQAGGNRLVHPAMFSFNPNYLTTQQWLKLGLDNRQAAMIKNYQAKGGRFYTKTDLKKIYAITARDYQRLQPYINLPGVTVARNEAPVIVELNTADSARLTRINGIGPGYAIRIMRYRDRLGGFYRKEQLKEIFGIDSLMYRDIAPQVKVNTAIIKKIAINKTTLNNFLVFPYLTYKQKNALIEYRNQHGAYTSLADLRNIPIIDEGILRKIEPYIEF